MYYYTTLIIIYTTQKIQYTKYKSPYFIKIPKFSISYFPPCVCKRECACMCVILLLFSPLRNGEGNPIGSTESRTNNEFLHVHIYAYVAAIWRKPGAKMD